MEILSGEQMRRVDRRTIEEYGISGWTLMDAAGRGVARALLQDHRDAARRELLVLCGKGNNGGDGLVAARYLAQAGIKPQVVLIGRDADLQGDAATAFRAAVSAGLTVRQIVDPEPWIAETPALQRNSLVLDGLLGTGVRGGARGAMAQVIEWLNRGEGEVASIDLPSGLSGDHAEVEGPAVRAQRTYTLCRPKIPLVFEPAASHSRTFRVVPIGIPDAAVAAEQSTLEWTDSTSVRALLPARDLDAHKGIFGHLLLVAGSLGKSGAALLAGRAALRAGVGLVTVATPRDVLPLVAPAQAELMTIPLEQTGEGCLARSAADSLLDRLEEFDAVAIGPGLGQHDETQAAVRKLVQQCDKPCVVDADGLNALAPLSGAISDESSARRILLTPHPGEAARLLELSTSQIQRERRAAASALADRSGCSVLLKGRHSIVSAPGADLAICSRGNPGMASAGTGDVLTGIAGALLARGLSARDAGRLAAYLHGDAGDRAAARLGQEGMIAGDLILEIPGTINAVQVAGGG